MNIDIEKLKERYRQRRSNVVNLRLTDSELKKLKSTARKLTEGNLTYLIRHAVFDLLLGRDKK